MTKVLFDTISSLYLTLRLYGYTEISGIVLNVLLLYTTNEKSQSADCELYRFPLATTRPSFLFNPFGPFSLLCKHECYSPLDYRSKARENNTIPMTKSP